MSFLIVDLFFFVFFLSLTVFEATADCHLSDVSALRGVHTHINQTPSCGCTLILTLL